MKALNVPRTSFATWLFVLCACSSSGTRTTPARPGSAEPSELSESTSCGNDVAYANGGEYLVAQDATPVWFRAAGPVDSPPVLFLHGGPGYNTYSFERAAGHLLEAKLRMLYLDQRGCGRSTTSVAWYGAKPSQTSDAARPPQGRAPQWQDQ
jgi:hypothetical protein